ncbi:ABC transporter ATP-binding protein/permease [Planotetraspora sp. A-T 1434]|uniref:ABC transporter ATP-binding protein n=1 Tax=Planotetraspora sp. A-T 1434 TaxID=2979219 RepID=UPI0021C06DBC|nr:ABC transporter ATP-binding protein [Planotetraspora sp. A-T 1434]MCT9930387.1 ABC transporter ATP-binding protein/permease [Planotetraspora sp. A-T 1434]
MTEPGEPGETWGSLLRHLRPGRRSAVALAAAIVAATVLPLLAPQLTRRFVDGAIGGAATRHLVVIALGYLAVAVAGQGARMVTAWLASRLAWDGTNRLRERLAEHALGLDMAYHGRRTPGEMIERVDGDVVAVAEFVVAFLLDVVASFLLVAGVLVVVFAVDPRLGGVLLVYCLLIGWGVARAQRLAVPSAAHSRAASAALFGNLEERLAGAEDLRANGAGEHAVYRFYEAGSAWYHAEFRAARIGSGLLAGTSVAFAAGTAIVLGLAAWSRQSGTLSVGTAVLLFQYTLMVRTPFERLIDQLRRYQTALAGIVRIGGLLAERCTLPEPAVARELPATGPLGLELDGVGFAYPGDGERVLSDVRFTLAPGETLGLVGRTGSGKTTIARMVLRLYDPAEGVVRVGGLDLRDVDPGSARRRMCVVTQDVQLFAASVRDNLTLFRPLADDRRLCAILAEVGLGDWLAGLPDGLDTELGGVTDVTESGGAASGVSAGEAQLLAFARALLADPGLVVLDEAASRLDPATERSIERCVDRLLTGRTGVIISHRLSSLSRVDKIAVIADGRVVEYGCREELVADPGSRFSRMLEMAGVPR